MPRRRYKTKKKRNTLESLERERSRFSEIIRLNPNYFGTIEKSTLPIVEAMSSNTLYEELGCIGYHPDREELHATIVVKQPFGYSGSTFCGGSAEYVRFYLKDSGGNWVDQGIVSFSAYNVPDGTEDEKDLDYAVTMAIDPDRKPCTNENLVQVRAILSWKDAAPPNQPDWTPVWGEVQEATIQIDKLDSIVWGDLSDFFDVNMTDDIANLVNPNFKVPFNEPHATSLLELHNKYKDLDVEPKRYLAPVLHQDVTRSTSPAINTISDTSSDFMDVVKFAEATPSILDIIPDLEIDWDELLNPGDGDASYEELECIGLDVNENELVGIIRVKKQNGYSGDLCSDGSKQYVAFWVDRDLNGSYDFLGMGNVRVYDLDSMPDDGLYYAVTIPVDVDSYRPNCGEESAVWRVRAILSWNTKPSITDPAWTPVWGNREEVLVSVEPARVVNDGTHKPVLESVGGIDPFYINSQGFANGPMVANPHSVAVDSPFGNLVTIRGYLLNNLNITNPSITPLKYKVRVRLHGGSADDWEIVGNNFDLNVKVIDISTGNVSTQTITQKTEDGFYNFQEDFQGNIWRRPVGNILAYWWTNDKEGHWELQVVGKHGSNEWTSDIVHLHLDNTSPSISIAYENECGDVVEGEKISGTYTAYDKYLQRVRLLVEPTDMAEDGEWLQPSASPGPGTNHYYPMTTMTSPDTRVWEFDTSDMKDCGYILKAWAYDRTIVNNHLRGWRANDVVGFCLRESEN